MPDRKALIESVMGYNPKVKKKNKLRGGLPGAEHNVAKAGPRQGKKFDVVHRNGERFHRYTDASGKKQYVRDEKPSTTKRQVPGAVPPGFEGSTPRSTHRGAVPVKGFPKTRKTPWS